jgi:hypothetical protein
VRRVAAPTFGDAHGDLRVVVTGDLEELPDRVA